MVNLTEEQRCLLILLKQNSLACNDLIVRGSFKELVLRHRFLPLLANKLEEFNEPVRQEFDDLIRQQVMKSMAITGELLGLYNMSGINSGHLLITKGPLISHLLYGEVGQRQFNDLDLHVRPEYFHGTLKDLLNAGYSILYPSVQSSGTYKYYFKYKRDVGLINPRSGVYIELHYGINILKLIPKDYESDFYSNLVKVDLLGKEIITLKNEFHFIYLCIHGSKHLYSRLIWLKDIADFLKYLDLDHSYISNIFQKYGLQHILGLSMLLVEEIFGAKAPSVYKDLMAERKTSKLKDICMLRIFGPEKEGLRMKILKYYYFMQLKSDLYYKLHILNGIFHRWYIRKYLGGH